MCAPLIITLSAGRLTPPCSPHFLRRSRALLPSRRRALAHLRPPRCELYPSIASVSLPEAGGRSPQTVSAAEQGNTVSDASNRQADRQLAVSLAAPTTPAATRWHALGSQPRPAPTHALCGTISSFPWNKSSRRRGKILAYAQRRLLSSRVYR